MKATHAQKQKKLAAGHGEYEMIEERDFFECAKKSDRMVVHFWRESTWRCEIMDKHLRQLCRKHWGTRFVKVNAEKAPYCRRSCISGACRLWCCVRMVRQTIPS